MNMNPYAIEQFSHAHHHGLLAEAARQRLLARLLRNPRSPAWRVAGNLGAVLVWLGTWLERSAQRSEQMRLDS